MGTFFDISFMTLNLFSFVLGMIFSFFNQGLFGKSIGKYIILYLFAVASYYGVMYHLHKPTEINSLNVPVPEVSNERIN